MLAQEVAEPKNSFKLTLPSELHKTSAIHDLYVAIQNQDLQEITKQISTNPDLASMNSHLCFRLAWKLQNQDILRILKDHGCQPPSDILISLAKLPGPEFEQLIEFSVDSEYLKNNPKLVFEVVETENLSRIKLICDLEVAPNLKDFDINKQVIYLLDVALENDINNEILELWLKQEALDLFKNIKNINLINTASHLFLRCGIESDNSLANITSLLNAGAEPENLVKAICNFNYEVYSSSDFNKSGDNLDILDQRTAKLINLILNHKPEALNIIQNVYSGSAVYKQSPLNFLIANGMIKSAEAIVKSVKSHANIDINETIETLIDLSKKGFSGKGDLKLRIITLGCNFIFDNFKNCLINSPSLAKVLSVLIKINSAPLTRKFVNLIPGAKSFPNKEIDDYGTQTGIELTELEANLKKQNRPETSEIYLFLALNILKQGQTETLNKFKTWREQNNKEFPQISEVAFKGNMGRWETTPFCRLLLDHAYICSQLLSWTYGQHTVDQYQGLVWQLTYGTTTFLNQHADLNWKKYTKQLFSNLEKFSSVKIVDALKQLVTNIGNPPWVTHITEEVAHSYSKDDLQILKANIAYSLCSAFLEGKTLYELEKSSVIVELPNSLPKKEWYPLSGIYKWHALFEPIILSNGIEALCLTDDEELEDEGRELKHCVGNGSFGRSCAENRCHIISFREQGKQIATLELKRSNEGFFKTFDGSIWDKRQFHGYKDGPAPEKAEIAWLELKNLLKNEKIELTSKLGATPDSQKEFPTASEIEKLAKIPASWPIFEIIEHHRQLHIVRELGNGNRIKLPVLPFLQASAT